jgi:hypothetical protein
MDNRPEAERQAQKIRRSMEIREINNEIDSICATLDRRMKAAILECREAAPPAAIEYATPAERERLYLLKIALPSAREERAAAKERLAERLTERRRKRCIQHPLR